MCVLINSVGFACEKPCHCDTSKEMHVVASCSLNSVESTFCPESRKKERGWGWHSCLLILGS